MTANSMEGLRKDAEANFKRIGESWWLADPDGARVDEWADIAAMPSALRHFTLVPEDKLYQWSPRQVGERFSIKMSDDTPVELETVASTPRLFLLHNLFTEAESQLVIDTALNKTGDSALSQSSTGFDTSGKRTSYSKRTSSNAWDSQSEISEELIKRAFEALRIPYAKSMSDGLQVLRYEAGEAYVPHNDWFPSSTAPKGYDWNPATGSNRYATVFLYLRPPPSGGYTVFPNGVVDAGLQESEFVSTGRDNATQAEASQAAKSFFTKGAWELGMVDDCYSKLAVKPVRLGAALFYHQEPMTGRLLASALHGACPSLSGVKWGANLWVWNRARHLTKPSGSAASTHEQIAVTFVNREQVYVDLEYSRDGVDWKHFWPMPVATYFNANTFVGHQWRMVTTGKEEVRRWEIQKGKERESFASDGTQGDAAKPGPELRYAKKDQDEL